MTYVLENLPWFVLLIGGLVFFHELGHFTVAKSLGIKVVRFSLGFGPRLLSVRRGETEYQLSLLPLGGYVKMLGDSPWSEVEPEDAPRAFSTRPLWQRTAVVLAGPAANLLLALVTYLVLFSGTRTFGDTKLGIVTANEPAWNAGIRPGDRIVEINGRLTRHWDELRDAIATRPGEALDIEAERGSERLRFRVQAVSHEEGNIFEEKEQRGRIGVSMQYLKPVLAVVDPESPAALAGLRTGDEVKSVNGRAVSAWHEVRDAIAMAAPAQVVVARGGSLVTASLVPSELPAEMPRDSFSSADPKEGYYGLVSKDVLVHTLDKDTPAAAAGILVGDRIASITAHATDGKVRSRPIGIWAIDLAWFSGQDARATFDLLVQRGRTFFTATLQLVEQEDTDELKNRRKTYVFGARNDPSLLLAYELERAVSLAEALGEAARKVVSDTTLIAAGLSRIVSGRLSLDTMGGPIMLFVIAEKSAKRGWQTFFGMMALISVNLGVLNLLPVPVLDGGHLLFFSIEAIRRRPPSIRVREVANMVGLALLILLMLIVFRNDFFKFVLG